MWEGECFQCGEAASAGSLTRPEVKATWKRRAEDESHPSNTPGPRDFKRVPVHVCEYANELEEAGKEKAVAQAAGEVRRQASECDAERSRVWARNGGGAVGLCRRQVAHQTKHDHGETGKRESALSAEGVLVSPTLKGLTSDLRSNKHTEHAHAYAHAHSHGHAHILELYTCPDIKDETLSQTLCK